MNKQLSFIHNGKRYMTLFGADEYLATALPSDGNVVECSVVQSSGGYNAAFKKAFGMQVRDIPIIKNPDVKVTGNIYVVSGEAIIDGTSRKVLITANGNEIEGTKEPEPVVEEVEQEPVVEEKKTEPEPEPVVEEVKPEPVIEEVKPEPVVEQVKQEPVVEEKKPEPAAVKPEPPKDDFMNPPVKSIDKNVGFTFGQPNSDSITGLAPGLVIGGETNNKAGFYIGGNMYERNVGNGIKTFSDKMSTRTRIREQKVNKFTPKKQETVVEEPIVEKPVKMAKSVKVVPEMVDEAVEEQVNVAEVTEVNEVAEVNEEVKADCEELKKQLRSSFSKEVNDVIGKIPMDMLGAIAEFTMHPIDTDRLNTEGELHCIDNRWCKTGKWYCIDVVPHAARYFYNSKLGISIEIPIKNCKDWLNAISK